MNKIIERAIPHLPLLMQLFRFGMVGLTAACVHFCIVVMLVQHGIFVPLVANIFGFFISFQMSYWGHRLWTFNDTLVSHRAALPKLLFVQILSFGANEMLFYILLTLHIPYPIALVLVLTILPIFTFISSKMWVFR